MGTMTSIFDAGLYEGMTSQIVQDVFQTMLSYEVGPSTDEYAGGSKMITAAIFLTGIWKGAVLLECSQEQARLYTNLLTGLPATEMNDDTRDAMGELINVIGGNLKSVLPKGVSLSIPSVLEGADYAYRICGSNQNMRLAFRGEAGALWVTLVQVTEVES